MGYKYHLARFEKMLVEKEKIEPHLWEKCAEDLGLKIEKGAFGIGDTSYDQMFYFSETESKWISTLVYSVEEGYGDTKVGSIPVLQKIGKYLNAFVYGDDLEVYCIPEHGAVNGEIYLADLYYNLQAFNGNWSDFLENTKEKIANKNSK